MTSSAAVGAGPAVLAPLPAGSAASRRRLSAPAASAIPPTAKSSFRGRGRRCRPRGRGAGSAEGPETRGENGIVGCTELADGFQGADGIADPAGPEGLADLDDVGLGEPGAGEGAAASVLAGGPDGPRGADDVIGPDAVGPDAIGAPAGA
ncbi:hypothetical protein [Streptomyces europaeiscabiei]|uniref:hypothetical protein n=1 Tax=Streptomyces europaeiscabiei TaxID=146819 RepID=UPI002E2A9A03|nr:hypothetical protein [Streptomyces europaeiscabiei]